MRLDRHPHAELPGAVRERRDAGVTRGLQRVRLHLRRVAPVHVPSRQHLDVRRAGRPQRLQAAGSLGRLVRVVPPRGEVGSALPVGGQAGLRPGGPGRRSSTRQTSTTTGAAGRKTGALFSSVRPKTTNAAAIGGGLSKRQNERSYFGYPALNTNGPGFRERPRSGRVFRVAPSGKSHLARLAGAIGRPLAVLMQPLMRLSARRVGLALVYHRIGDPPGDPDRELVPRAAPRSSRPSCAI